MLNGKNAVITGSTSGIGLATAELLAAKGCNVVINSFTDSEDDHRIVSDLAKKQGVDAIYVKADMSKPEEARGLIEQAASKLGSVDILVNNAGIQYVAPIEEFPTDKWNAILAINLSAAFHTSAAAVPGMRDNGWGRIVNIASAHGLRASPHKAAYVAAKHGIVGLTKVVAVELAGKGVTCNAVCPGFVHTPLVEKQIEDRMKETGFDRDKTIRDVILEKQPSKQFATVEQIAASVAFLASDDAAQITGTTLSIDGGWTAQ